MIHAHNPPGYAGALFLVESSALVVTLTFWRGRILLARPDRNWGLGITAGALSVATYTAVLWAQTRLPLGIVSSLRETSVVVAALLGTVFLHEGSAGRRLLAASAVCVGVAVLVGA